jgi:ATP-dependent DNA helicase RecG
MNDRTRGGIHYPLGSGEVISGEQLALAPSSKRALDPERLNRPVASLRGVGKTTQRRLAGLGLQTIGDLLLHLPFRHELPSRVLTIAGLTIGNEATLRVQVVSCAVRETARRRVKVLEALVSDETGSVVAVWYNQAYLETPFQKRPEILVKGILVRQWGASVFLVKRHEILGESGESFHILGLVPVYPSTADLSVRTIRNLLHQVTTDALNLLDPLPAQLLAECGYPGRAEAVQASHFPVDQRDAVQARERLAFEELLLLQVAILCRRRTQDGQRAAQVLAQPQDLSRRFLTTLPFTPTGAQVRVMAEIDRDISRQVPMRRLLHGDVGSGKTLVAAYCMLRAIEEGGQAALMAPTEVLADQHYLGLSQQLEPLGVRVGLLKGSQASRERKAVLRELADGEIDLLVGTHALIQDGVVFKDLLVAVVDEQHRFGVRQRDAILAADRRGCWPHTLHMSATPIPRTLSLTLYGDLDVSTLDESPPGRSPVTTRLVFSNAVGRMWEFVRHQLREGRQAYVVCPLIEESDVLQTVSARDTMDSLSAGELVDFRLHLLHGQLPAAEKATVMAAFVSGEVDVLVSTTVIEVGIDVPNATVMVILGARRFGLSQLHQLRGRVGRGEKSSYCLLVVDGEEEAVLERLALFARTTDGFALAEADLATRGEGQLFGDKQSGLGDLHVASLLRDRRLLEKARGVAARLVGVGKIEKGEGAGTEETTIAAENDPVWRPLLEAAEERFGARLAWIDRV